MRNIFILLLLNLSLFAYVEDFNIYDNGTRNSDLNKSGITFESSGKWIVFSMPFSIFDTPVLLEPSSTKENSPLTMSFNKTQCNSSFDFATDGEDKIDVVGYYQSKEVYHKQLKGTDRGGSYVGNIEINTKLDSIKIYTIDRKRLLIDNVKTSTCTLNNYNLSDNMISQYSFEQNTSLSVKGVIGSAVKINRALKLDKYVDIQSLALWFKAEDIQNQSTIIQSISEDSASRMKISINVDGFIEVSLEDAFFSPFVSDTKLTQNSWTHLALTKDNDELKIYINNRLNGTYTTASKLILENENFLLGDDNFGSIDEVRLYSSCITQEEVQELYYTRENFTLSHDEGFEEGKQFCIDNPKECGLVAATTSEDVSIAKDIQTLQGKTFDISWHLFKAGENRYLVSADSNNTSLWQLVPDTRQWKPVHNAEAHDGFEAQEQIFDSIIISDDASNITFSNESNISEEN